MMTQHEAEQMAVRLEAPMTEQETGLAFARWRDARAALSDDAIITVNCDIRAALSIVTRALPRVARVVPAITEVPSLGPGVLDELRDLVAALMHAQILYAQREHEDAGVGERRAIVAEAVALLARLELQLDLFEALGVVEPRPAVEGKRRRAQATLEDDLARAVNALRGLDAGLEARMSIDERTLDRAIAIQPELGHALQLGTAKPRWSQSARNASRERARAFTLVADRYARLAWAVALLRWDEGDAEELTPSLRARSARPSRRARRAADEAAPTPAPAQATQMT